MDERSADRTEMIRQISMRDLAGEKQLLFKSLENAGMARQFRAYHLQGHQAVEFAIPRFVDRAHAALAQEFQNFVAIGQVGNDPELSNGVAQT